LPDPGLLALLVAPPHRQHNSGNQHGNTDHGEQPRSSSGMKKRICASAWCSDARRSVKVSRIVLAVNRRCGRQPSLRRSTFVAAVNLSNRPTGPAHGPRVGVVHRDARLLVCGGGCAGYLSPARSVARFGAALSPGRRDRAPARA
jgi:hypothetical protein